MVTCTTFSPSPTPSKLRRRVVELLRTEIDFVPNPEFAREHDVDDQLVAETIASTRRSSGAPSDLPAHLRRMCEIELLTHRQESALFREMNLLKFQANLLRSKLDPDQIDAELVEAIDVLLSRSQTLRDHIIKANMRLVMSIVKKFVTPQQSFDEMLSDGILTLMHAVEKFDFDRGFRFSTYAYRSIARSAFRAVMAAKKEDVCVAGDTDDWAFEPEDYRASSVTKDKVWSNLRDLATAMLDQLDRRERFIIRSRYALGSHRKTRTFQYLADMLGISKERARQLEQRAVAKMQAMAGEFDADELFGASLA